MSTLQDEIEKLYYDPKFGFNSNNIYRFLKSEHPDLTLKKVKDVVKKQESHQLFSRPKKAKFKKVIPNSNFSLCQIDLMDFSNEVLRVNKNFKFLFCFVDTYSKIGFAIPIKNKTTPESLRALKIILKRIWEDYNETVSVIQSDNESAFLSKQFQDFLEENDIVLQVNQSGDHKANSFIESFNRTIRGKIKLLQSSLKTNNWVDYIGDIIYAYNNTIHSTIKKTPVNAIENNSYMDKRISSTVKVKRKLKIDDRVRLLIRKNLFEKGTTQRFTSTIHKIVKIESGNKYFVSDRVGFYKDYELLPISEEVRTNPNPIEEKADVEHKENISDRRVSRRVRKEGVDVNHKEITDEERSLRTIRRRPANLGPYISY